MVLVWKRWNNNIVWCLFLVCLKYYQLNGDGGYLCYVDIVDCFQKDDIDCFNVILQCGLYWNTFTVRVHIHWTIWFVCTCICLIFFKDVFKYPLIIKVPFYFAIISWHALVFCSLSRHWYLRSQSLTSWMIHTPKVKCSKDPDCHRRCGIFTKIIFTCWKNFQDTGMY